MKRRITLEFERSNKVFLGYHVGTVTTDDGEEFEIISSGLRVRVGKLIVDLKPVVEAMCEAVKSGREE